MWKGALEGQRIKWVVLNDEVTDRRRGVRG